MLELAWDVRELSDLNDSGRKLLVSCAVLTEKLEDPETRLLTTLPINYILGKNQCYFVCSYGQLFFFSDVLSFQHQTSCLHNYTASLFPKLLSQWGERR